MMPRKPEFRERQNAYGRASMEMRRLIEIQARLLGRFLLGEIADYPHYLPR